MCRTRLAVDNPPGDEAWLNDQTYGHIHLVEAVANALHNFIPQDVTTGQWFVVSPMKMEQGGDPEHGSDDDGYGEEVLYFDVQYRPPMDATINVSN
jgi:hypothetical protein